MLFCNIIVSSVLRKNLYILYIQTSGSAFCLMQVYEPGTILSVCLLHTADSGNKLALSA